MHILYSLKAADSKRLFKFEIFDRRKNPDLWHKLENCLICCWCCCYVPKTVVDEARFAKDVADTAQETVQNNRGGDSGRSSIVKEQPQ